MEFLTTIGLTLLLSANVSFDVPAMAPAQTIVQDDLSPQLPDSRFIAIDLDVTTIVSPEFHGEFNELMIEVRSQHEDVQVADFSPRTAMYSNVAGNVRVSQSYNQDREASVNASGFYPVFAKADGHAAFHDNQARTVEMEQVAPMEMLTSSGTLDRRTGVYFKLRKGPQSVIEGAKRIQIVFEVPASWRGDLVEVRLGAYGNNGDAHFNRKQEQLAAGRYFVALYQQHDPAASEVAMRFVREHLRLQNEAHQRSKQISRRSIPTPVHYLGKALELYEPAIANDWLEQWVFGSEYQKPNKELPVDLRVVMLDFQDARTTLLRLAHYLPVNAHASMAQSMTHATSRVQ